MKGFKFSAVNQLQLWFKVLAPCVDFLTLSLLAFSHLASWNTLSLNYLEAYLLSCSAWYLQQVMFRDPSFACIWYLFLFETNVFWVVFFFMLRSQFLLLYERWETYKKLSQQNSLFFFCTHEKSWIMMALIFFLCTAYWFMIIQKMDLQLVSITEVTSVFLILNNGEYKKINSSNIKETWNNMQVH